VSVKILQGDCREMLRSLPDASVHCVVTSPPYFGLRDYGTVQWEGGDPACDHQPTCGQQGATGQRADRSFTGAPPFRSVCGKCGARRIDSQIGLEQTPDEYVAELVAVFRECRRVLRNDGTLWLNLGDSYASFGEKKNNNGTGTSGLKRNVRDEESRQRCLAENKMARGYVGRFDSPGLKPKDLIGIPWMVAFALRADGWYLRSDIIWAKPNPMPESVTDRPTKAHEYLFLLSKSARYYFDQEAVREDAEYGRRDWSNANGNYRRAHNLKNVESKRGLPPATVSGADPAAGRNIRSVWTVATQPFSEAHFATFPPDLIEPCIKAGTSEKGCCAKCGAPWVREMEQIKASSWKARKAAGHVSGIGGSVKLQKANGGTHDFDNRVGGFGSPGERRTGGWSPSCKCDAGKVPCMVLDPFGGAGTSGLVADRLQRNAILIELNEAYVAMAERRIAGDRGGLLDLMEAESVPEFAFDAQPNLDFISAFQPLRRATHEGGTTQG
jgi:DNA modification methylase